MPSSSRRFDNWAARLFLPVPPVRSRGDVGIAPYAGDGSAPFSGARLIPAGVPPLIRQGFALPPSPWGKATSGGGVSLPSPGGRCRRSGGRGAVPGRFCVPPHTRHAFGVPPSPRRGFMMPLPSPAWRGLWSAPPEISMVFPSFVNLPGSQQVMNTWPEEI